MDISNGKTLIQVFAPKYELPSPLVLRSLVPLFERLLGNSLPWYRNLEYPRNLRCARIERNLQCWTMAQLNAVVLR